MKKIAGTLIAVICLTPAASHAGEHAASPLSLQEAAIRGRIAEKLSGKSQWAVVAVDVETGKPLVDTGSGGREHFMPGSLMKLFVTAAVLEQNSRETIDVGTLIAAAGELKKDRLYGDILVKGAGNAFLTTGELAEAVEKIRALGIREISGGIVIDDSLFDAKEWKPRYAGPAYGIPSALGLDLHTVSVSAEGSPAGIRIDPPNDAVKVSINPSGRPGVRQIDDLTYEVTGATQNAPGIHKRFSLADPALYAGGTFLTLIRKAGIRITGGVKRSAFSHQSSSAGGMDGHQYKTITNIGSRNIKAYINDTNQHSLNVAADNLLLLLGALKHGQPGTREKGVRAIKEFLNEAGIPLEGLNIHDGCGISEFNRISAEQMAGFLRFAAKRTWFKTFFASLSRPGIDGRLRDFGYRSRRMHLKSGQVADAYCLAGYVDRTSGRRIAFAYMLNGPDANAPTAGTTAIEVLKQLAR